MAEPLSLVANVAGVVGLADVVCRLSRELYTFFTALKDASHDVQNMLQELEQLEAIILNIQNNAREYRNSLFATDDGLDLSGVSRALQGCQDEFTQLQAMVEKSGLNKVSGTAKGLANKVSWVLEEKKISKSCQRLERLKLLLTAALTTSGR